MRHANRLIPVAILTALLVAGAFSPHAPAAAVFDAVDWQLSHEDAFERDYLGTDWLILRGDWHINRERQLQIQRQWSSHSFIANTLRLRGRNIKIELDFMIPAAQKGSFGVFIQAGPLGWGGGGIDDRVGLEFKGVAPEDVGTAAANVALDAWQHLTIELVDGHYRIRVGDRLVADGEVPQGRSLINSGLQFSACPGARVDNLRIHTAPMARPLPPLNLATPEENARATVFAERFLDPARPDCGFQAAIDALPPGGGVVVLPAGDFTLRRFLDVPSHTTLAGQGAGVTTLRVIDATAATVESFASAGDVHTLVLAGDHDFRPGDAFSYGRSWGHPINAKPPGRKGHELGGGATSENRLLVLAVAGNTLTVNAPPPSDKRRGALTICHFFPPVCSYESEFADVKDVTIVGPQNNPAGASGGFMTNPVTFGVTSNSRLARLDIRGFPADGISMQGCDDARVVDCSIGGTAQGLHPGTTTMRMLIARNLSVDNGAGLYFCWYNTHGVYFRNLMKNMTGYPDAGDVFNTIAANHLTAGMHITVGYNGCLFGNTLPSLGIFGAGRNGAAHEADALHKATRSTYDLPPRHFTIGHNTIEQINLFRFARGNVIAGNRTAAGAPTPVAFRAVADAALDDPPEATVLANDANFAPLPTLPAPITRETPVAPPALPPPVLDGREFHQPDAPDAGFQRALDRLEQNGGGTLRLPGGRYALGTPLRIPANVTLAGWGTGTILLPAGDVQTLLLIENAANVVVRDLAIEGDWSPVPDRGPALLVTGGGNVRITAVDIRGWAGAGIAANGADIAIRDCRVLRAAGAGYVLTDAREARLESSSAVHCATGVVVERGDGATIAGCIAALNSGAGYRVTGDNHLLTCSNAHNNRHDGIQLADARNVTVAGNTSAANNQAGGAFAGIRLGDGVTGARVLFNNCGDEQLYATQLVGIREEPGASHSEIRFNTTATVCTRRGHAEVPSLLAQGQDSEIGENWTESLLPSYDSLEALERLRTQQTP